MNRKHMKDNKKWFGREENDNKKFRNTGNWNQITKFVPVVGGVVVVIM